MTVGVQWDRGTRAADASQAAYFRGFLIGERKEAEKALSKSRARLRRCIEDDQVVGLGPLARARIEVRELEAKKLELDRLIAALDRRFTAVWER